MADVSYSRYCRVLHSSLGHPKFIGLTAAERGTWQVALLLADIAHPEPVHESAVRLHCPDASFDRLYERTLLEAEPEEGWFRIHDLRQFHVAPSETPEAAAERQRRSRARRKEAVTPVTPVTPVTDVTPDDSIRDDNDDDSTERRVRESESPASAPRRPTVRGFKGPIERAAG